MIRCSFALRLAGTIVFTLGLTGNAMAQLEEVVVTAQKRAEDVQEVPISITTVSGDFMVNSGADTLQDMSAYVPNLSLTESSQVANNRIIMRGVGSVGNNAIEPSVAVFIDGVYYPRPSSVVGGLTDLQMVEVLRGPQGTMFGRNASMGALNIHTAKPTQDFQGKVRLSYGDYDSLRTSGYVSGGITDNTAGRLSFHYSDRDGYGTNTFKATGNGGNVGAWEDYSLRGQLDIAATDNINVNLSADYAKVNNKGTIVEVLSDTVLPSYVTLLKSVLSPVGPLDATGQLNPQGPAPDTANGHNFWINQDQQDNANDEQWGIAAHIDWKVADHTIRSITSYRDWSNSTYESALRLPGDLLNRDTGYKVKTVSQELQIVSPSGGKFEYVAGLYYYNEDYSIDQNFDIGADFCSPAFGNLVTLKTAANGTAQSAAIAQVDAGLQAAGIPAPLSTTIATGLVQGTITTTAQLNAMGIPAPLDAVVLASASPATVLTAANAIGGQASALCAAGPSKKAIATQFNQNLTSFALYGQLTYNITDKLRLTGGLRWTNDDKSGSFTSVINNPVLAPASVTNPFGLDLRTAESDPNLSFQDDEVTWLLNVSYDLTDNIMAYGLYSTGYKTGGFNSEGFNSNAVLSGASRVFNSETVDNYEFGVKSRLFDNHMVANLSYYNTEISNFQDRQFDGVNFLVQNAGVLTQQGMELDIQAQPTDHFYAVIGVSLLNSNFDSFPNATNLPYFVSVAQATNTPIPPRNLTGAANHFSPFFRFSLMGEWSGTVPVKKDLGWYFRLEEQYTDDQNLGAETNDNPQTIQKGYHVVNARLGIRSQNDKWELAAFVKNAFDKGYCQTIYNQPIGTTIGLVDPVTKGGMQRCVLGTPRVWGVEATYSF